MKWFTCTPMDFEGGPGFFGRDSGLMCRGLQALGVESRAVMTGVPREDDESDLIRAGMPELESAAWWAGHRLDGVLLYAWGSPRFRRVAGAIHEAGVTLVLNQDSSGWISPLAGFKPWWREQRVLSGGGTQAFGAAILKGLTIGLLRTDPLRAVHLKCGDRIACVSPGAVEAYRRLCRIYGGRALVERVVMLPHPVNPVFHHDGGAKERRVVAVGRWDARVQKRPGLLMKVMGAMLEEDDVLGLDVVGRKVPEFDDWLRGLPEASRRRVVFHGVLRAEELRAVYRRARVLFCPSAFESFHLASGEALCCGCTVAGGDSASLPALRWFAGAGQGTLAGSDDAGGHRRALAAELAAWDAGMRDPREISTVWTERLHAPRVADRMLGWFRKDRS